MASKKKASAGPRCPTEGCKIRLEGPQHGNVKCAKCGISVCAFHQFPTDHDCKGAKTTAAAPSIAVAKPAGALQVAKAPAKDDFPPLSAVAAVVHGAPSLNEPSSPALSPMSADAVVKLSRDQLAQGVVQAAAKDRLLSKDPGVVVRALETGSSELRDLVRDAVVTALSLEPTLADKALQGATSPNASEARQCALVVLTGMLAGAAGQCSTLQKLCSAPLARESVKLALGNAFAEAMWFRRLDTDPPLLESADVVDLVAALRLRCLDADKVRVCTLALAGIAKGARALPALPAVAFKRAADEQVCALAQMQANAEVMGRAAEPWVTGPWMKETIARFTKGEPEVRKAALACALAVSEHAMGPVAMQETVPAVEAALADAAWRAKEMGLCVVTAWAQHQRELLQEFLPSLVLLMAACVVDSKKEVALAAASALDAVGATVSNPETRKLMPHILAAIKQPDTATDKCLEELMDATFVNSLGATSVALIVPVVTRALREGSADLKRRGAVATGNVCALVRDVNDVRPFAAVLRAELDKLKDHGNPPVRKAALVALERLDAAMKDAAAEAALVASAAASAAAAGSKSPRIGKEPATVCIAREALAESWAVSRPPEVMHFALLAVASVTRALAAAPQGDVVSLAKAKALMAHASAAVLSSEEADAVAASVLARVTKLRRANGKNGAGDGVGGGGDDADDDEVLVDIPDVILAFASRVLLSKTRITLRKNHRYAVVGKIGVGKTTLASRLARGDIEGFPADVKTYMVLHEVGEEGMGKTALQYMGGTTRALQTLREIGFVDPNVLVSTLSGGWRMRLAIGRSMLADADLIVLDEPTNHVDVAGVKWLADYLTTLQKTVVVVSHDYDFLAVVATDVLHLHDGKLDTFAGDFGAFQRAYPEVAAGLPRTNVSQQPSAAPSPSPSPGLPDIVVERTPTPSSDVGFAIFDMLSRQDVAGAAAHLALKGIPAISFPDPGKLEGVSSKGKPIMTCTDVTFAYPTAPERAVLRGVTCRLSLNSRIALRGANGQGKSTLLKLMVGELEDPQKRVWKHHNLRVAYVAQHAAHHLEEALDATPVAYLQRRYYEGRDKEREKMITLALTEDEKELMEQRGEICGITSRVKRGKQLYYEIEVQGRRGAAGQRSFGRPGEQGDSREYRSLAQLEALNKPHVIKLVRMFDEELKYEASGMSIRPVTAVEILKHLGDFGIPEDFAERKIRWLSGGQRSRLVLASAMWHKPHLVALDEPTNFLDAETLAVLTHCLRTFKGAVLTVSHHQAFVATLCNEAWDMDQGKLEVKILRPKFKVGQTSGAVGGATGDGVDAVDAVDEEEAVEE